MPEVSWIYLDRMRRWGLRGGITVLDQGLFSGSSFVLNILLARWLAPASYGAFAVAFAIYLFFTGFHNALILEPMSVLGPANHADKLPQYISYQFRLHAVLSGGLGLLMVAVGSVLGSLGTSQSKMSLASGIVGAGIALPFMLFIWLVRRIYYVLQNPAGALSCSLSYSCLLGVGIVLVRTLSVDVGLVGWYLLLGAASFVGALLPLLRSGMRLNNSGWDDQAGRQILHEHWNFGRWLIVATVLYTVGAQIQVFLAAGILDLESAGTWKAVQNFALPMVQSITAVATLGLPVLAQEFGRNNFLALRRKGLLITLLLTIVAGLYEVMLIIFSRPLEHLVYGDKFAAFAWLIPLMGLVPVLASIETGFSLIVRSLQRPVFYLIYNASMALAGILFAPILIIRWGLAGAAISQIVVAMVSLAVILYIYRRWFPKPRLGEQLKL